MPETTNKRKGDENRNVLIEGRVGPLEKKARKTVADHQGHKRKHEANGEDFSPKELEQKRRRKECVLSQKRKAETGSAGFSPEALELKRRRKERALSQKRKAETGSAGFSPEELQLKRSRKEEKQVEEVEERSGKTVFIDDILAKYKEEKNVIRNKRPTPRVKDRFISHSSHSSDDLASQFAKLSVQKASTTDAKKEKKSEKSSSQASQSSSFFQKSGVSYGQSGRSARDSRYSTIR